jgi:hypothetical protein
MSGFVLKIGCDTNSLGCTNKQEIEWERFGLVHKDVWMIKIYKRVS